MTKPQTDVGRKQVKNYGRIMYFLGLVAGFALGIIVERVLK